MALSELKSSKCAAINDNTHTHTKDSYRQHGQIKVSYFILAYCPQVEKTARCITYFKTLSFLFGLFYGNLNNKNTMTIFGMNLNAHSCPSLPSLPSLIIQSFDEVFHLSGRVEQYGLFPVCQKQPRWKDDPMFVDSLLT